jgi:putative ABC transport system permease protein
VSFLTLIVKNLLRRPLRSLLTIVGIAVGIGAVVALTSLAWGFERSWTATHKARGTDLIVTKASIRNAMPTPFPQELRAVVEALPHVQEAPGTLVEIVGLEDLPSVVLFGWEPGTFLWSHLTLEQGRWPDAASKRTVALGVIAAEMLGKKVGDAIQIEAGTCTVGAIFSSAALAENGGIVVPLAELQALMNRPGMVNFFNVRLVPGTTPEQVQELRAQVTQRLPGLKAFSGGEVAQANAGIQIAKAMSLATSLIALFVGAIGIMNTILMSVFERLHEIGVLLALGWRRARIRQMILAESLVLSLVGGVAGCGLGVAVVRLLQVSPWIRGKLEAQVDLPLIGVALLIALGLGALGGLYPAWIGSRMSPVTALRHE